jgi:hypothetical protein
MDALDQDEYSQDDEHTEQSMLEVLFRQAACHGHIGVAEWARDELKPRRIETRVVATVAGLQWLLADGVQLDGIFVDDSVFAPPEAMAELLAHLVDGFQLCQRMKNDLLILAVKQGALQLVRRLVHMGADAASVAALPAFLRIAHDAGQDDILRELALNI